MNERLPVFEPPPPSSSGAGSPSVSMFPPPSMRVGFGSGPSSIRRANSTALGGMGESSLISISISSKPWLGLVCPSTTSHDEFSRYGRRPKYGNAH